VPLSKISFAGDLADDAQYSKENDDFVNNRPGGKRLRCL
jgi:hypothetical protein